MSTPAWPEDQREALWRVVDRCVQVLGGRGVTGDTVVERIFRDIRPFRIYDGPSEVHRMSLAKKLLDQRLEAADAAEPDPTVRPRRAPRPVDRSLQRPGPPLRHDPGRRRLEVW